MDDEITVSIVCYTYNQEKYIEKCIEGMLMQIAPFSYEIIVHDDASTDRTAEIIDKYASDHPFLIKVVTEDENKYTKHDSFEEIDRKILEIAKGEYIAICEGDDYWTDPYKLSKQVEYMNNHSDCTLCAHESTVIDVDGNEISSDFLMIAGWRRKKYFKGYGRYDSKDFLLFDAIPTASLLFRKNDMLQYMDQIHGEELYEDLLMRQFLVTKGYLYYMRDNMAAYRYNNPDSMIGKTTSTKECWIKNIEKTIETYKKINSDTGGIYKREIERVVDMLENDKAVYCTVPYLFEDRDYYVSLDRVLDYCRAHEKIYIYGAGLYGRFLYHILMANEIAPAGFVISDGQNKDDDCDNISTYWLSECAADLRNSGVVICNERHEKEIIDSLYEKRIEDLFVFHIGKHCWHINPECVGVYKDIMLSLRITNRCPGKCRFCGLKAYSEAERKQDMDPKWYYKYLLPLYPQIKTVLLTGGDGLYTPEAYKYMEFLRDEYSHITVCLEGNGVLFNEKIAEYACANLCQTHFSINGSNKESFAKGCWEGEGAEKTYKLLRSNYDHYIGLLKRKKRLCFAPSVSMVINKDNAYDVLSFIELSLRLRAGHITFYFDYTESNMYDQFFSNPEISREALKIIMEAERVLKGKILFYYRLWVPSGEIPKIEREVESAPYEMLKTKYRYLLELSKDRDVVKEYNERNEIRKLNGKPQFTMEEELAGFMTWKIGGKKVCKAPWNDLDIYPSGRIDFCGWHEPTINIHDFIKDDEVMWDEIFNCEKWQRIRAGMLHSDYHGCLKSCPMNKQYRDIDSLVAI